MPDDLRSVLEVKARESGRSLNAEIVARLERDLSDERKTKPSFFRPAPAPLLADDVMPWLIAIAEKIGAKPPDDFGDTTYDSPPEHIAIKK